MTRAAALSLRKKSREAMGVAEKYGGKVATVASLTPKARYTTGKSSPDAAAPSAPHMGN